MQIASRLTAAIILAGCAACSPPPVTPPDEKPPEPQVSAWPDAIQPPVGQAGTTA